MSWRDKITKRDDEIVNLIRGLTEEQIQAAYDKSVEDGILCPWKLLENLRAEAKPE